MNSKLQIIGIPYGLGGPCKGCEEAPNALRMIGFVQDLRLDGHKIADLGNIDLVKETKIDPECEASSILESYGDLVESVLELRGFISIDGEIPIFLGGDHTISAGTIPLMASNAERKNRKFFVLWIDAHSDLNTLSSTKSGNIHGTPLAYCLGDPDFVGKIPRPASVVDNRQVCLIGVRDFDKAERVFLKANSIKHIPVEDLNSLEGISELEKFLTQVADENADLHVSIDLDAFDEQLTPAVNTPVTNGIDKRQANMLADVIRKYCAVSSLDLVELNPRRAGVENTIEFATDFIRRLLK